MKPTWGRNLMTISLVVLFLAQSLVSGYIAVTDAPSVASDVERTWEGGGSRLLFVDTMSGSLAGYLQKMKPLPGGSFDYYDGAVPQVDGAEVAGLWGADRWRHDWWRWGEESTQTTEFGASAMDAWNQTDVDTDESYLHFGGLAAYPHRAFSAVVSPVVDLRGIEPIGRPSNVTISYRDPQDLTAQRTQVNNATATTQLLETSNDDLALKAPALQNTSAALRLRHAYGFETEAGGILRDGSRVEVSALDPVYGWLDWQAVGPSANKLRVGEEELAGRYATPMGGVESGWDIPGGNPANATAYADDAFGSTGLGPSAQPWMYQGEIQASNADRRGAAWPGFGGTSNGFVESVFDLTPYAGRLIRFRFLVATGGDEAVGQGWLLDQMEVHGIGKPDVQLIAAVTPTDGALLAAKADPPVVVAVQNTHTDEVEILLRAEIEGRRATSNRETLPPGPWGRVFHTFPKSVLDLAPGAAGLQIVSASVTELFGSDDPAGGTPPIESDDSVLRTPSAEGRFHFQLGGPEQWRVVRVVTEVVPTGPDDVQTRPDDRVVLRGQKLLVHVDLENLGPKEITLDFDEDNTLLVPRLVDPSSALQGTFNPPGTLKLPPSREASGSLGNPHALRRATWEWSGIPQATILTLLVDRFEKGALVKTFEEGTIRVETMQANVLSVDLQNHWRYSPEGCHRQEGDQLRRGLLVCSDKIESPASPVAAQDLRRGSEAYLFALYKGAGNVTLQTRGDDPDGSLPTGEAGWVNASTINLPAEEDWVPLSAVLGDLGIGWIRAVVDTDATLAMDELRIEVGPSGKRLPLLWHTFSAEFAIETTGSMRSVTGGHLALLDAAVVRPSDHGLDASQDFGVGSVELENNEVTISQEIRRVSVAADSKAAGVATLQLPEVFHLFGARPTLRFSQWMSPSPAAIGYVDASRVNDTLGNLTWDPVVAFPATLRNDGVIDLEPVAVPLSKYAGESIRLRFRYQYDAPLQPGNAPLGWVLDGISVDQMRPGAREVLHSSSGNFTADGYLTAGTRFVHEVKGSPRALPRFVDQVEVGAPQGTPGTEKRAVHFGIRGRNDEDAERNSVCSSIDRPSTYHMGQSVITDPLDLRALEEPVFVLEHGGRWLRDRSFGHSIFDIEYQNLGEDGLWGPWRRASPNGAEIVGNADTPSWTSPSSYGTYKGLQPYLQDARVGGEGGFVANPFASVRWGQAASNSQTLDQAMSRLDLVGPASTMFSLQSPGPAGHIARFRFHLWDSFMPGSCLSGNFDWYVYSMKVFEATHLFDSALMDINVSRNDRTLLDRADPLNVLSPDTVVVADDAIWADVLVENQGKLGHLANVTLQLLDDAGNAVPKVVHFLDRSGTGPGVSTPKNYGSLPLQPEQGGETRFRVEFNRVHPGNYTLRAVVDLDDALDTNPDNDVWSRPVRVVAVRDLDVDVSSATLDPAAGTPEDRRLLSIELRNLGNVRDSADVQAKVVELIGVGRDQDIGPAGDDGKPIPYTLQDRSANEMPARAGTTRITWDLVGDHHGDLLLEELLEPGHRYAVNVTVNPAPSVRAWWQSEGSVPPGQLIDATDPGTRCGCFHIPFLVESLLAASDFTDQGTFAMLPGYLDTSTSLNATLAVRDNGIWRTVNATERPDLPHWHMVNGTSASQIAGGPTSGNAWSLPAHEGFEAIQSTLTSPPLPGHIIDSDSQAILGLQYAMGNSTEARVEVRTLLPGGKWAEWEPVDGLRSKRIAVVLPPDYPKVIADRTSDHPIPPFYTANATQGNGPYPWNENGPNVGLVENVTKTNQDCNANPATPLPECTWSPFPMFPKPGQASHNRSAEALATVLRTLADAVGPHNVGVFTTFPEDGTFGEFGVPENALVERGIEFDPGTLPILRVTSGQNFVPPHEFPVLSLDALGRGLGTYGALLVMGDGLTRYAAGNGLSFRMEQLSVPIDAADFNHPNITRPTQGVTTNELDRHFEELLQILGFAEKAGVRLVGGLGPAPASIGMSGIAQGVPLALWLPPMSLGTPQGIPLPLMHQCLVDGVGGQAPFSETGFYYLNLTVQPKNVCIQLSIIAADKYRANYVYARADDVQAAVLRDLMVQGGATLAALYFPAGSNTCGNSQIPPACASPLLNPVSFDKGGVRFVTAGRESLAEDWANAVLQGLATEGALPAGSGTWQEIPVTMATPVGGTFRPDVDGRSRFVGETVQFRIVVASDPLQGGHGMFLLGGFRLLGTPPAASNSEVRIVDPVEGVVRQPGETFHVVAEVVNRGLNATDAAGLTLRMAQVPGAGDCNNDCIVHSFHPVSQQGNVPTQTLAVPSLDPGARYVVTLGGPAVQPEAGAPGDVRVASQGTAFNGGRFPAAPPGSQTNPELWFNVTAELAPKQPSLPGIATLDDVHSVIAVGKKILMPLVKDPERDVRVLPNQAFHSDAPGLDPTDALPITGEVGVSVRLTNQGSSRAQVGAVQVEVHAALPHECQNAGTGTYFLCHADGTTLANPVWSRTLESLEVSRGSPQEHRIPVNLDTANIPPGVYRVEIDVTTTAPVAPQHFERWVYLAGSSDGPWATYEENLEGVPGNVFSDSSRNWNMGSYQYNPSGAPVFWDGTSACRSDATTRQGPPAPTNPPRPNSIAQQHGWRISDALGDSCGAATDASTHALHWVRPAIGTFVAPYTWIPSTDGGLATTQQMGHADYGPDAVIWHPGHDSRMANRFVASAPESLANFDPGTAALVLETRFQATPRTAYVVEMQVAARRCLNNGPQGLNCQWVWDWGAQVQPLDPDRTHWFPLQASGNVTTDMPPVNVVDRDVTCLARTNSQGKITGCTRPGNTNPLGGTPGIWGGDSANSPDADAAGWVQVRYPIDPAVQNHSIQIRGFDENGFEQAQTLYTGLAQYCIQASSVEATNNGPNTVIILPFDDPIRRCMYSLTQGGGDLIPRPVAFRLRAASYSGDQGANRWQVGGLSLTAHALDLEGPKSFVVPFTDGQGKVIPIEIRNAGPVDDVVSVTATPAFPVSGLDVGIARSNQGVTAERQLLSIPSGESRTAWVRVSFGYGAGGFSAGDDHEIDIDVRASSIVAPTVGVRALLTAVLHPLDRADLVIGTMVANGNEGGTLEGAQGVPVDVTLLLRNEGTLNVHEPVVVRMLAKRLDPDNMTRVLDTETAAQAVVVELLRSNCVQARCSVPVNLRWTPSQQGVFEIVAEVNLPRLTDDMPQIPESEFANNEARRRVNVGAVPLADLRILDVRLVRFDGGCAPVEQAVSRLVASHSYCVATHVVNVGQRAAVNPVAEFSVGASAPFSKGQGGGLPNPLNGSQAAWVFSSPVRATLPPAGNLMEFQVQLDTLSATASVEAKGRILFVPVDAYRLELQTAAVPPFDLAKGSEASITLRLRNTGTAIANAVVRQASASDLRVHLTQPPPLQPGEEAEVLLVLQAGLSAAEGPHELGVVFSTAEDPQVAVPLQLIPIVVGTASAPVSALPLRATPGNATSLDLVIDNAAWAQNGTWAAIEATGPLLLGASSPLQVSGHDVEVRGVPVSVRPFTPPGPHEGLLRLRATHGLSSTYMEVPYMVDVLSAPALAASMPVTEQAALRGIDARLTLVVQNTGNVPLDVSLEHSVDNGAVLAGDDAFSLEPAANRSITVVAHADEASRSLGQTTVRWRQADGSSWQAGPPLLWTIHHVVGQVVISSTDLEGLRLVPGKLQTVRAFLHNPGTERLEAEGVLVIDGILHSRQRVEIAGGAIEPVDLPLRVEAGRHTLQVLARPAGSTFGLAEPVFHAIGDVDTRETTVSEPDGGLLPVDVPGTPGLVAGLAFLAMALARRGLAR